MPPTSLNSSTKTPRTRRKRRVQTTTTTTTTKNTETLDDDKENHSQNSSSKASISTPARDSYSFADEKKSNETVKNNISVESALRCQFLQCLQETTVATDLSNTDLVDYITQASLSNSLPAGALHLFLEDRTTSLISASRKLIKEATAIQQQYKTNRNQALFSCLFVACHTLRAVGPLIDHDSNQMNPLETILRLLYHLVQVAAEASKGRNSDWRLQLMVLSAYETLQHRMYHYACPGQLEGTSITFRVAENSTVPILGSQKHKAVGTMSLHQVSSIALKTAQATAMAANLLWQFSIQSQSTTWSNVSKAAPMYGKFCNAFVRQQSQKQNRVHPHQPVLQLFQHSYLCWLEFLADSKDDECLKDISSHSKVAHRILWDTASLLKTSKYKHADLNQCCLELRMQAVLMLLPQTNERSTVVEVNLENACNYAWKAATVFAQSQSSLAFPVSLDNNPLADYHQQIGTAMDPIVSRAEELPLSYVEYSTYRLLHTAILSPVSIETVDQWSPRQIVMAISLLGVLLRQDLEGTSTNHNEILNSWEQLMLAFDKKVISRVSTLKSDECVRYFNLLSMVSLHRFVFLALKQQSWIERENSLHIAGVWLTKCLGPFALALLQNGGDALDIPQTYDMAIECYIRPLSVFEKLCKHYVENKDTDGSLFYSSTSDDSIQELYHHLNEAKIDPPIPCLEKYAKSLSILSRQRAESSREHDSILPQLISLQLYQTLVISQQQKDQLQDYQLPVRLNHLATVYQSLGKLEEARLVLFSILALETTNFQNQMKCGTEVFSFVNFLAGRSKRVLPPGLDQLEMNTLVKSTIRRLVALFCESSVQNSHKGNAKVKRHVPLSSVLDMLLQSDRTGDSISSLMEDSCGIELNFTGLLSATLQPIVKVVSGQTPCNTIMMLVEVLVHFGGSISRLFMEDTPNESFEYLLVEYESILLFAEEGIFASFDGSKFISPLLVSLLNLVASTSLLPFRSFYEDTVQGTNFGSLEDPHTKIIKNFARRSRNVFESVSMSELPEDWLGLAQAIRLSVWQYSLYLDGIEPRDDYPNGKIVEFLNLCKDTVNQHAQLQSKLPMAEEWIKWTLMNIQSRVYYEGDRAQSTTIAFWALSLVDEDNVGERSWFCSVAISSYLSNQSAGGASSLSLDETYPSKGALLEPMSFTWLAAHELVLSVSSLQSYQRGQYQNSGLGYIKDEIERSSTEGDGDVFLLSKWLMSTIEINQARAALHSGNLATALEHIQSCSACCQTVMSKSRNSAVASADRPLWVHVAKATLFVQSNQRYADCLLLKSRLYIQLGDYRKASTYVWCLPQVFGFEVASSKTRDRSSLLRGSISSFISAKSSMIRNYARLRIEIDCLASPSNLVIQEFSSISPQVLISSRLDDGFGLEMVQDLITAGNILYGEAITSKIHSGFMEYYREAFRRQLSSKSNTTGPVKLPNYIKHESMAPFATKFKLLRARCLLEATKDLNESSAFEAKSLCQEVIEDSSSSSVDRSWAYFYAGSLEMNDARESGALHQLWTESRVQSKKLHHGQNSLENARQNFLEAATLINNSGSDVLYRTILRSLALASGPEMDEISGESAGILVLSSIGRSARRQMTQSLFGKPGTCDLHEAFLSFDHSFDDRSERDHRVRHFFRQFAKVVPSNWYFMAPTICMSGELLVTFLENSKDQFSIKTKCVFPDESQIGAYDDILKPLDDIIMRSQQQLNGMDPSTVSTDYSKDNARKNWWDARNQLDHDLCTLIECVESRYFSTLHLRINMLDSILEADHSDNLPCGNLASRFEAACDLSEKSISRNEDGVEELRKLTVPELKDKLRDFGFSNAQMRKLRKHEIIEKLIEVEETQGQNGNDTKNSERSKSCLFLLLDENLHRFPFEGMRSLQGKSVCRTPSLPFVYATLLECASSRKQMPCVDPSHASFVLDPENNLQATQKRLFPVLEGISSSNGWSWNGVIGENPSQSLFQGALEKENGLLIYIGHGGAQNCFSRRQVDQMICSKGNQEVRACKASVILMGCSSGRLVSVNRKHSESLEQLPLYFEPEGIALSYLCAGAPCVIGNMWDVTDHDIDRFSISLFQKFFGDFDDHGTENLASCVASARSACKLKYIVGCAPVCYGVPVHLY